MKLHLAGIVALLAVGPLFTQPPKPFDFNQAQSPPKPLPAWIKAEGGKQVFIDQGQFDPRLKGYFTPEGLRVEIVADFPSIVNPVGMTFGDDGTLYVIEWLGGKGAEGTRDSNSPNPSYFTAHKLSKL